MFDSEGSRGEFLKFLAEMGEEPAFVTRARSPQAALDELIERCELKRDELLIWPRRHFSVLRDRVLGDWSQLGRFVADVPLEPVFSTLNEQLPPIEYESYTLLSGIRGLLRAFFRSGCQFNSAWTRFLDNAGLDRVNEKRDAYNRYYPIEKACAFGGDSFLYDFSPLPMLDREYLESRFPLLRLPVLA